MKAVSDLPIEIIERIFTFLDLQTNARCMLHVPQLASFTGPELVRRIPGYLMLVGDEDAALEIFSCFSHDPHRQLFTYLPNRKVPNGALLQRGGFVIENRGLDITFRNALDSPREFNLHSHSSCHMGLACSPEWHTTFIRVPPNRHGFSTFEHRHNGFDAVHCDVISFDLQWFVEAVLSADGNIELTATGPISSPLTIT